MQVKDDSIPIKIDYDYPTPMRDGTILRAMVYRPDDDDKHPVILCRTPYNKEVECQDYFDHFLAVKSGYVVVNQDTRGRGSSEGEFEPFVNEFNDGYDTVEYLAKTPWSDGNIGMYGASYVGFTQLATAVTNPPHLKVITPLLIGTIETSFPCRNGLYAVGTAVSWILQLCVDRSIKNGGKYMEDILEGYDNVEDWLKSIPAIGKKIIGELNPFYLDWMEKSPDNDYWKRYDLGKRLKNINIPILSVAGFYDVFIENTEKLFASMREGNQNFCKLIIGPWVHEIPWDSTAGDLNFGGKNNYITFGMPQIHMKWFDRYLKGEENGLENESTFQIFDMGTKEWLELDELPGETMTLYLSSEERQGLSLSLSPVQDSEIDILFDPDNPVPTLGGLPYRKTLLGAYEVNGAYDQRQIEARNDVLSFTANSVDKPIKILGNPVVTIYAKTPSEDLDISLKLVDVHPDGKAFNLTESTVRGSFIQGQKGEKIVPENIHKFDIKLPMTCISLKAGHSIRLDMACSNYPGFEVLKGKKCINKIFVGSKYPSNLVIPVKSH